MSAFLGSCNFLESYMLLYVSVMPYFGLRFCVIGLLWFICVEYASIPEHTLLFSSSLVNEDRM